MDIKPSNRYKLTSNNLKSIGKACLFAFVSGFLATLTAQGGFQVGIGFEGVLSLLGGALVAGINGVLFTLYKLLED